MGLFKKKNKLLNVSFIDGLDGFTKGLAINIEADDDNNKLVIKSRVIKKPEVNLKYEQITQISAITEKDIVEKSKTVVGRAVIGGVLLGPLGAIVGGMSGIGNKQKAETHYYMVINYKSKEDEIKALSFEIVGASIGWDKFISHVRSKINTVPIEESIYL